MTGHRLYSSGAATRRRIGGCNVVVFDERWPVTVIRQQYRFLRRSGAHPETARYALWSAAWMGGMHKAQFVGKSEAFPDMAEVTR